MVQYSKKDWEAYDPDELLNSVDFQSASQKVFFREDVLAFNHVSKKILIDLGFYGSQEEQNGEWIVYVIGDNDWGNPIIEKRYKSFSAALKLTFSKVNEYST